MKPPMGAVMNPHQGPLLGVPAQGMNMAATASPPSTLNFPPPSFAPQINSREVISPRGEPSTAVISASIPSVGVTIDTSSDTCNLLQRPEDLLNTRERIIKEIYNTESDYVVNLSQLVNECYNPVLKGKYSSIFTNEERKKIYGNIEVVRSINVKFLTDLSRRITYWHSNQLIGDVFKQMMPFFKVYKDYYNNYEAGLQILEKLSKKKEVKDYLKACENVTNGHKLSFLLVMPVQRIPRYSLLLNELMKHTPSDHPDYATLLAATENLREFTMNINESVRETENIRRFTEMVTRDPKKYIGFDQILAPHRQLIHEGEVTVRLSLEKSYTWLLIFSDLVVFASSSGKKKTVEEKFDLNKTWCEDLPSQASEFKFRVIVPGPKMFVIDVSSESEKQLWLASATRAITDWLTRKDQRQAEDIDLRRFSFVYESGMRYEGTWKHGQRHGSGTCFYPSGNMYVGDFVQDKRSGQGKMIYNKNGGVYDGDWKDDKPSGKGILKVRGSEYSGDFSNGVRHGKGEMSWSNGDKYTGNWCNNHMHGNGILRCAHYQYEGEWDVNSFSGKGVLITEQGVYSGTWSRDRKTGEGKLTYKNGDSYTGEWKDNEPHGKGVFTGVDGSKYDGEWELGRMNGQGTLIVPGQYSFSGGFRDDRKNGMGTMIFADKSRYEGTFADDRKEGKGLFKDSQGNTYEGLWHSDKKFGKGKLINVDGSSYEGEWVNNRKEGKGVFIWPDKSIYSGTWVDGRRSGKGAFSNGDETIKYTGEWEDSVRHGRGVLTDPSGSFDGEWRNDMRNGSGRFETKDGLVYEGTWVNDELEGIGTISMHDGTSYEAVWKDGNLERPGIEILPPPIPQLKIVI